MGLNPGEVLVGRCVSCGERLKVKDIYYRLERNSLDPYSADPFLVYFCRTCALQLVTVVMESEPQPSDYHKDFKPLQVKFTCTRDEPDPYQPPSLKGID